MTADSKSDSGSLLRCVETLGWLAGVTCDCSGYQLGRIVCLGGLVRVSNWTWKRSVVPITSSVLPLPTVPAVLLPSVPLMRSHNGRFSPLPLPAVPALPLPLVPLMKGHSGRSFFPPIVLCGFFFHILITSLVPFGHQILLSGSIGSVYTVPEYREMKFSLVVHGVPKFC